MVLQDKNDTSGRQIACLCRYFEGNANALGMKALILDVDGQVWDRSAVYGGFTRRSADRFVMS